MLCDICKQPLEPWEVTTCELCGEILQNSLTSALTQTEKQSTLNHRQQGAAGQTISKGLTR